MNNAIHAKPFEITKRQVWDAYKRVKANQGAAGVDGQSIADFEENLKSNLYKLWNRLASGSYFPPPVRRVEIPKGDGRTRPLGIPTVADRIAQIEDRPCIGSLDTSTPTLYGGRCRSIKTCGIIVGARMLGFATCVVENLGSSRTGR